MNDIDKLYKSIMSSIEWTEIYSKLTNNQLIKEVIENIWAELPITSKNSALIDVVCDRLCGKKIGESYLDDIESEDKA